jgi:hypothetical protein
MTAELAQIEYRAKSAEGKVRHPFFLGPGEVRPLEDINRAGRALAYERAGASN